MKKYILITAIIFLGMGTILTSCKKDLQQKPTNGITPDLAYKDFAGYQTAFAKVYGSFALTGNQGPAGNGDIQGIDEGTSDFLRLYWWVQEISTDEAVVQAGWNDPGIHFFHSLNWSSDNVITKGVFYRSFYQITLANEFIRQSDPDVVAGRGITGADAETIKTYALEARFLRAYQYSILIDLFGNVPFVTEDDAIGGDLPHQIMRADLFNYIETELKDLEGKMPVTNEYGRATRPAVTALLARMYLNAEVYTGTGRYNDAADYATKTLSDGFTLIPDYRELMLADNNTNTSEFIMTINYDGIHTQSYGGTTFLTHAPVGGSMPSPDFGISGGWSGVRTTSAFVSLFPDVTGVDDQRAQFYTNGQSLNLTAEPAPSFTEGYAITKYRNVKKDGSGASSDAFSDVDFPIFRSAEMNLIYAEAVLRGATTGNTATAVDLINDLRTRASAAPITDADLNLDFIIKERGRELYWECFRRTDLIRFNQFVEDTYLWPWKGGNSSGTSVPAYRKLFPLPNTEINSNPNLVQNPGY
ncbi:MAG: RagB/SusD family nutrient uptake outer membrane protein [Ferruginibacter sp.]